MEKKELAVTIAKDLLVALLRPGAHDPSLKGDKKLVNCGDMLETLAKRVLALIESLPD